MTGVTIKDEKRERLHSLRIDRGAPSSPRSWPVWARYGAPAAAGLAVFFSGYWLASESRPKAEQTRSEEAVAAPAAAPNSGALSASGFVTARRRATISSDITGRIVEVYVEEGAQVSKGQILARLDSSVAQLDMQQSAARYDAALATMAVQEAQLEDAKSILARTSSLSRQGFVTKSQLSRDEANVSALEAQVSRTESEARAARIQVDRQRDLLSRHIVRAPFAGVIIGKFAQPGEIVSPSSAGGGFTRTGIYALVDMGSLEFEVEVNESQIQRVRVGQRVNAILDAYPDWSIPAHVLAVIPTASREKASIRVRVAIDVNDLRILPDMAVAVRFLEESPLQAKPTDGPRQITRATP